MSTTESQRLQEQYGISDENAAFVLDTLQSWKQSGISSQTPDEYLKGIQQAFKDSGKSLDEALTAFRETTELNNMLPHSEPTPPRVCVAPPVSEGGIDI